MSEITHTLRIISKYFCFLFSKHCLKSEQVIFFRKCNMPNNIFHNGKITQKGKCIENSTIQFNCVVIIPKNCKLNMYREIENDMIWKMERKSKECYKIFKLIRTIVCYYTVHWFVPKHWEKNYPVARLQ